MDGWSVSGIGTWISLPHLGLIKMSRREPPSTPSAHSSHGKDPWGRSQKDEGSEWSHPRVHITTAGGGGGVGGASKGELAPQPHFKPTDKSFRARLNHPYILKAIPLLLMFSHIENHWTKLIFTRVILSQKLRNTVESSSRERINEDFDFIISNSLSLVLKVLFLWQMLIASKSQILFGEPIPFTAKDAACWSDFFLFEI